MITADTLNAFGLDVAADTEPFDLVQEVAYQVPAVDDGSVTAQALLRVWRGDPLTVIASGPGCGKTTALVTVVSNLVMRAGLNVVVATPTRAQAFAVATALYRQVPGGYFTLEVSKVVPDLDVPADVAAARISLSRKGAGKIAVRTLSSCEGGNPPNAT